MERIVKVISALVLMLIFVFPLETQATGLGIYFPTYGSGTGTVDRDGFETERDISHFGGGFVLDTRVADRGVFNYRLQLGFESVDYLYLENFSRLSIDNTFGFGIVRTRVVRVWLGPQIRIAYMGYSSDPSDINTIGFALAPVLGVNINIGDVISLCPALGYRVSGFIGTQSYNEEYYLYSRENDDWSTSDKEFFVNFSIIFRINDVFF